MTEAKCGAVEGHTEEAYGQYGAQPGEPSHGDGLDDGMQQSAQQIDEHEDELGHTYAQDKDA